MIKASNMICFMHGTYAQSHVVQWSNKEFVLQRICLTENTSYSECLTVRMSHTEHVEQRISDAEKLFTDNVSDRECPTVRMSNTESRLARSSNVATRVSNETWPETPRRV